MHLGDIFSSMAVSLVISIMLLLMIRIKPATSSEPSVFAEGTEAG